MKYMYFEDPRQTPTSKTIIPAALWSGSVSYSAGLREHLLASEEQLGLDDGRGWQLHAGCVLEAGPAGAARRVEQLHEHLTPATYIAEKLRDTRNFVPTVFSKLQHCEFASLSMDLVPLLDGKGSKAYGVEELPECCSCSEIHSFIAIN